MRRGAHAFIVDCLERRSSNSEREESMNTERKESPIVGFSSEAGKTRDEPAMTLGDRDKCSLAFPESIKKTKVWSSDVADGCLDSVPVSLDSPNGQNSRWGDGLNGDSPFLRSTKSRGSPSRSSLAPTWRSPSELRLMSRWPSSGRSLRTWSETAGSIFTHEIFCVL
jgi:hypothetical protein